MLPEAATFGVDLASQPERTAVCRIEWTPRAAAVTELTLGAGDPALLDGIRAAGKTGIDAPLGWPVDFVAALADPRRWRRHDRDRVVRRATDHWVRQETKKIPLSVKTDRIAYPAMRAAALLAELDDADRSGMTGPVCETYPDPSIRRLGLWPATVAPKASYKGAARDVRAAIVARLPAWLEVPDRDLCVEVDDCLDALVCALVARAALLGQTVPPPPALAEEAQVEGWIHLPVVNPALLEASV